MSLSRDLKRATAQTFRAADSVLTDVTYRSLNEVIYSPPIGEMTVDYSEYLIRAALSSFKQTETTTGIASGSNQYPQLVQPNDKKCTFPRQLDVLPSDFSPKLADSILEDGSPARIWNVIRVLSPPGAAVIILHLREI